MQQTFENLFRKRNPNYAFLINRMQTALNVKEVSFNNINSTDLRTFKEYMETSVSPNSLKTYFAVIKAFCRECENDGLIPSSSCTSVLKSKTTPSEQIALTEEEINRIEHYVPRTQAEKHIKAQFLCECYCLARSSDIKRLTEENIRDGFITYVSQKTHVGTSVPLHKNFLKYFHQRGREYSRAQYNKVIKRICQRVGIDEETKIFYHGKLRTVKRYELVGSHTARRSGISALAVRGVPLSVIQKLANHTNTTMTERYVVVNTKQLEDNVMAYFS